MSADAVFQGKFFVKLIPAHLREIVSARVKKHCRNKALRTLNRERLAWSDFLI